ncbi:H-2 class II histocompatibility antigen, A-D beta chain-like isoform X2, partial [Clarias magur]
TSVRSRFICPCWMLLLIPLAVSSQNCTEFNQTESIDIHHIHQGQSITISCHYNKKKSQYLTVMLRTKYRICEYHYSNKSWTKTFCNDNVRLVWISESEEISFQLINLQINNSDMYTCTVLELIPPPTRCLGQKRIFIHVKAPPSVSVSCVKWQDGASTVLCAAEGFYPADLQQSWLRDEEYISSPNISLTHLFKGNLNSDVSRNYSTHSNGIYNFTSYLHVSSSITVYYCWVNHSSLSQPIVVNISSTECTEGAESLTGVLSVTGITCGLMATVMLIFAGCYYHL